MPEVKPWMRRATREAEDNCKHGSDWACGPCYIKSLAAHAPPVEEMVEALRIYAKLSRGLNRLAIDTLIHYDSWLAKQDTEK